MASALTWSDFGNKDLALVPGRVALGATMLHHGKAKLSRSGLEQHAGFFEQLGLKPAKPMVLATGIAELLSGASVLLGIGTRIAALAVLVTQGVAVAKVHAPKGFDTQNGGFEFNLSLMALALGLLVAGPGRVSAHEIAEHRAERTGWRRLLKGKRPSTPARVLKWLK